MSSIDHCRSFPYVASPEAELLILGSMPGKKSLEAQQYYAHPQNVFWDIMESIFGIGRRLEYLHRLEGLLKSRVALWDVAFQCRRAGSLDADIEMETVVPNDFENFFSHHRKIHTIFFNGQKAEDLFRRLVVKNLTVVPKKLVRLPSTSPAHASLGREQKQRKWRQGLTQMIDT